MADEVKTPETKPSAKAKPDPVQAPTAADKADKIKVRATSAILVFDPSTGDHAGEKGGEMAPTQFVLDKIEEGVLEKA